MKNKDLTNERKIYIMPVYKFHNRYAGRYAAIFVPEIIGAESLGTVRFRAACYGAVYTLCAFFIGAIRTKTITKEALMERPNPRPCPADPQEIQFRDICTKKSENGGES